MAEPRKLTAVWTDLDRLPIAFANAFASQAVDEEYILSFGVVALPTETESHDEGPARIPVQPVVRVAMTQARLRQLAKLLHDHIESIDQQRMEGRK